jgi:hypothetical protein
LIGGFLEVGPDFPLEPGMAVRPGPVWALLEAFIMVRSLKSVEKDGRPYSDRMDEVMYESLRSEQNPKIRYRLVEMSLKGITNNNDIVYYEFESRGELSIAGITNEITMPVFVLPMERGKLRISGRTSIKMTSFQIEPPAPKWLGMIKTGDDVVITFDWMVGSRATSEQRTSAASVPSGTPVGQQSMIPAATPVAQEPMIPAASIRFINTDLAQVLAIYAEMAQAQLDIEDEVRRLPALIRFTNTEPVTRAQAIVLLDNALLEQAGILVTHPESNRVVFRLHR